MLNWSWFMRSLTPLTWMVVRDKEQHPHSTQIRFLWCLSLILLVSQRGPTLPEVFLFFFSEVFLLKIFIYFFTTTCRMFSCSMWESSSLSRDWIWARCIQSLESQSLDHQGSPWLEVLDRMGMRTTDVSLQRHCIGSLSRPFTHVF